MKFEGELKTTWMILLHQFLKLKKLSLNSSNARTSPSLGLHNHCLE